MRSTLDWALSMVQSAKDKVGTSVKKRSESLVHNPL